jgi:hypothetical protein
MSLADQRTHLIDGENNNNVSGDTTAAPTSANSITGTVIEGTNSINFQVDDAQEALLFDQDTGESTFSIDMSDITVYAMVKYGLGETFANLGGQIVLGDGADGAGGDIIGYNVVGADVAGLPYVFGYKGMKLDVSVVVASPGTNDVDYYQYNGTEAGLNHAAILQVGFGSFGLVKAVSTSANAWFDGFYYHTNGNYAVSIEGGTVGTPETMADVVGDDEAVGMGLFNNPKGSEYGFFGPTEWGDGAAGDTYFTGTDEQWYWIGDNAGGHVVAAGHFLFRLNGVSGSTNSFVLTRVVIVNTGRRAPFDISDADMDFVQLDSCTLIDVGAITCNTANDADKFLVDTVFINCDQIDPGRMNMDRVTFNGSNDATGALLLDETQDGTTDLTDLTFNSDGTGHGIQLAPTGAGPFTYNFDNFQNTGYGADDTSDAFVDINPVTSTVDITINLINGAGTITVDETGYTGTLTINNTVEVSVSGVTEGTPVKIVANETVGTITSGDVLATGFADSDGVFSYSQNYESAFDPSGLDVLVRARNQGVAVAAISDDGGVFTDETDEAHSNAGGDVTIFPTVPIVGDASYVGHNEQFFRIKYYITTALDASGYTFLAEYWDGGAWSTLGVTADGTSGMTETGIVEWTDPGDWATTTVNGQGPLYYMRLRITVLGTWTTSPVGAKIQVDTTRYIPYVGERIILSTGLADFASWAVDSISKFDPDE